MREILEGLADMGVIDRELLGWLLEHPGPQAEYTRWQLMDNPLACVLEIQKLRNAQKK